ncbi:HET-domain-containing protein [Mytilinidion resinicola]|uniref:HET-domain-containing protein n=1 Tax=Mytilinidion resinicola TaxID=574789 RepID=A0A6A6YEY4_9PEZI|nr:HET-domain-containing protein [Mytilinidion resinicola]KAF2807093.1 HET-domain-containing protein [Mytilinidion resinicola]
MGVTPRTFNEYCSSCREFLLRQPKARPRIRIADEHVFPYAHHTSLAELRNCASEPLQPCRICGLILHEMGDPASQSGNDPRSVHIKLEESSAYRADGAEDGHRELLMHVGLKRLEHHLVDTVVILSLLTFNADYALLENLGPSTSSPESFSLAKTWLQRCLQGHDTCRRSTSVVKGLLPTRLIEVSDPRKARLCISSSLDQTPLYLTLSHSWGKKPFTTLTTANLDQMQTSIPFETLPQNFQDAILITFELGYRYIWIDSLCILQDSATDWATEASLMAQVYQNSTLTISASAASHAFDGCFRDRTRRHISLPSSPFPQLPTRRLVIANANPNSQRFVARESPLRRRGWVLQEEILSPRLLHFTHDGLFWECETHSATELAPAGLDPIPLLDKRSVSHAFSASLGFGDAGAPTPWSAAHPWHLTWANIVRDFSERSLTYAADKLVALSGVARVVQTHLGGDEYLAGLWRGDLLVGLCWSAAQTPQEHHARPEAYRAPSWSWAAVDGAVTMRRFHLAPRDVITPFADLVDAGVELAADDAALGQVTGGFVKLDGVVLSASVVNGNVQLDDAEPDWLRFRWTRCGQSLCLDVPRVERDGVSLAAVFLVPVVARVNRERTGVVFTTEICLLMLEEVNLGVSDRRAERTFRRVGMVSVFDLGLPPDPFWLELFPRKEIVLV